MSDRAVRTTAEQTALEQPEAGRPIVRRADGASPRRRGLISFGDPRGRRLTGFAFIVNRVTGLGILLYLFLHLMVLSLLAQGPSAWDNFVSIAGSPVFVAFDIVLIFGLLYHGLNGIRVTLVGFGLIVDRQKALFVALMIFGAIALVVAAVRVIQVE